MTDNVIYHLIRAVRPRQWMKNLAVFAPIVIAGEFLNSESFSKGILAFLYFSSVASAIYLINDVVDMKKDQMHPVKKNRPIASGKISRSLAIAVAIILTGITLPTAYVVVGSYFGIIISAYFVLQLLYNFKLKDTIIVDAIAIALGFILRVFAGALALPVSISSWLILAVTGGALLIAFGKRRAERTLLAAKGITDLSTRKILNEYPDSLLDSMISVSASFFLMSYALFTFQTSPEKEVQGMLQPYLPSTLAGAKILMLTIPVVIYAVARYLYVIYEKREGESPERIMLKDKPLLFTAIGLVAFMVFVMS